jgi:hypothetical protein
MPESLNVPMPSDTDVEDICERIRALQAATAGGAPGLTVAVRSAIHKRDVEISALRSQLGRAMEALRVVSQAPAYEAWARELCAQDPSIPMKLTMRVDEFIPMLDLLRELAGGEGEPK